MPVLSQHPIITGHINYRRTAWIDPRGRITAYSSLGGHSDWNFSLSGIPTTQPCALRGQVSGRTDLLILLPVQDYL
jgi:hypothetical protein